MTVSYSRDVFLRTVFRWKGSIWKAIWLDLVIFLFIYYATNIPLRLLLNDTQKEQMRRIKDYFSGELKNFNLIFILGFFLSHIMTRLWGQFELAVSTPFNIISTMAATVVPGSKTKIDSNAANLRRRSMTRWLYIMAIMSTRRHCIRIKKRFPTNHHMVQAGLMTDEEERLLKETKDRSNYGNWWQPSIWVMSMLQKCTKEKIIDGHMYVYLTNEVMKYRGRLKEMMNYHWMTIPLPYTQMVSVAIFVYFQLEAVSHQMVPGTGVDIYFPVFVVIRFGLYVGILRVGEFILDPFGEEDDDFEMNWLLDWNTTTGFLQLEHSGQYPKPSLDTKTGRPFTLPHTFVSSKIVCNEYVSLVDDIELDKDKLHFVNPDGSRYRHCEKNGSIDSGIFNNGVSKERGLRRLDSVDSFMSSYVVRE